MKKHITLLALTLGALTPILIAQNGPPPRGGQGQGQGQGGPGGGGPSGQGHHRMPPNPLVQALDTNHDGTIDASEIANASQSLLTLDKNGDGQLTPDEYQPKPPKQGNQNNQNGRRQRPQNNGGQGGPGQGPPPRGQGGGQNGQNGQNGQGPPPPPDGQGGQGGPPPNPLAEALDLNHDGTIDASEIAKASQSLLTLDKNGDGKLTPDEYRPQPPQGGPGGPPPNGQGGQNGQGRPQRPPGQ